MKYIIFQLLTRIVTVIIISPLSISVAQDTYWQKTIGALGNEFMGSMIPTSDGGYILGAASTSDSSGYKSENNWDTTGATRDFWVVKLDTSGNVVWENSVGGTKDDFVAEIIETADGGFIVGGTTKSEQSGDKSENGCNPNINYFDYWIVKLDASGNLLWENTITGLFLDRLHYISPTSDGGFISAGTSNSNISCDKTENNDDPVHTGTSAYWVVKFNSFGTIDWQNTIGGGQWSDDLLYCAEQTTDGGYILGGVSNAPWGSPDKSETSLGGFDYWVIKLDSTGIIEWENTIGGNGMDMLNVIKPLPDGSYICGGHSYSDVSSDKTDPCYGGYDYWILKLDSAGNIIWQTTLGGNLNDELIFITPTDDGFICGGNSLSPMSGIKTENNVGSNDVWIIKLDTAGSMLWQNTIGGSSVEYFSRIFELPDENGFMGSASSYSNISGDKNEDSFGGSDLWIFRLYNNEISGYIKGLAFIDLNSNSIKDPGEVSLPYRRINLMNSNRWGYTNSEGDYSVTVLDSGNYSVTPANPLNYYNAVPMMHTAVINTASNIDSLNNFAYQPAGVFNDLCVTIAPVSSFIPGSSAIYEIRYINTGTTVINGLVHFYPGNHLTFVTADLTPSAVTPDSVSWSVGMLSPFQSGTIQVTVQVAAGLSALTSLISNVIIQPVSGDADPGCNIAMWETFSTFTNNSAYMLVDKDTITTPELSTGPFLDYIINFQNNGSDTVSTVKILNTIDTLRLDLSSFELITASHPLSLNYTPWERNLEFLMNNVSLPDSTSNPLQSLGFVRYRIKPKTTLQANDSINNSAGVYFDGNEPVLTNSVETRIVLPNIYTHMFDTVCGSLISPSGNYTWTSSGTWFDTIPVSPGLDSIFIVYLIVNNSYITINASVCESYISPSGNYTWITSGTYTDTLVNAIGCDSVITIHLMVNNSASVLNISACENYISPAGVLLNTPGTYFETITNAAGCDSSITINLLIIYPTNAVINPISCESYTSPSGNFIWFNTGTYWDTIPNAAGCDSIIGIDLVIIDNVYSSINDTACNNYISPSGNYNWTVSGVYQDTLTAANTCDSVLTINLVIDTIDISLTNNEPTLSANAINAVYQWMYCDSILIVGAVSQSFTATTNGSYAVIIDQNGCVDTSSCVAVTNVNVLENVHAPTISIFPNPVSSMLTIQTTNLPFLNRIVITDVLGKNIFERDEFDESKDFKLTLSISTWNQGIYYISFIADGSVYKIKFVKS